MHAIIVTNYADRVLYAFVAGNTNCDGRWVCQQCSLILLYSITTVDSMDTPNICHFLQSSLIHHYKFHTHNMTLRY